MPLLALLLLILPPAHAYYRVQQSYFEDPSASMTAEEVVARGASLPWVPLPPGHAHFGFSSSRFWIRFSPPADDAVRMRSEALYLEIPNVYLERIGLHEVSGGRIVRSSFDGLAVPRWMRDGDALPTGMPTFRIPPSFDSGSQFLLSVEGSFALAAPLRLMNMREYAFHHSAQVFSVGAFLAVLVLSAIFAGTLAAFLGSLLLADYAAFLGAIALVFIAHEGVSAQFLWPNWTWWAVREPLVYMGLMLVFYARFLRRFLESPRVAPILDRALVALASLVVLRALCSLYAPWGPIAQLGRAAMLLSGLAVFGISIEAVRHRIRSARWVLASSTVLNVAILIYLAQELNFLWIGQFVHLAPHFGILAHVVMLGLALADRIRQVNLEYVAQKAALTQTEKLSSLGRLAGEIAHEINNPLAIIHGNAVVMRGLVEKSGESRPELVQVASAIESTATRISTMVKGMRRLARDSRADPFEKADSGVILQDALVLFRDRARREEVRLDFPPGPGSLLYCRASEICQVLVNLLDNAFDAVEGRPDKWVRVELVARADTCEIAVLDSGPGVPESIRERVHEPFYTTKSAGKGVGLGLSISRTIVESHGGRLWLDAASPCTRFAFTVPLATATGAAIAGARSPG